jgi:hypothetical protein
MLRTLVGLGSVAALFSTTISIASEARADATANAQPEINDTRFGEIGKAEGDPTDEKPPVTAGVSSSRVGRVSYTGTRVDTPLSKKWSLIPQAALLYIAPYRAGDPSIVVPYIGGGVGYRPAPTWSTELSAMYGPRAHGLESVSGTVAVGKELGGDWSRDLAPPVTLEFALGGARFLWENGNGPAGPRIFQAWLQSSALVRLTSRLHAIPRGTYYVYDHSLSGATGDRLGSISVLAQVGSYAPRALAGGRIGYWLGTERVFPFVDAQEIVYAEGVGTGTQLAGGVRVNVTRSAHLMAMGGLLHNRVSGPLVSPDYDLTNVPVVAGELEIGF